MISTTAKYIYTVYKLKSVSVAAEKLYISQPALSRAIKKAESELGSPIFNRKTLPFSLTAEGKVYIENIEKILKIEQEAVEKIKDKEIRLKMAQYNLEKVKREYLSETVLKNLLEIYSEA